MLCNCDSLSISIMAEAPQDITILKEISSKFNALSATCPVFDGSGDIHIEDFLEDVIQYCNDTGRSSHQEMLQCLLYHLQGEAKSFSRIIHNKTWHNVITQLRHHYGYSPTEKLNLRASLFQYKQAARETFQNFAIRLQQEARLSDLKEEDLVNIAIYGAQSNIKTHLQMAQPQNFQELLKLPIVRDEASIFGKPTDNQEIINQLTDKLQTIKDKLDSRTDDNIDMDIITTSDDQSPVPQLPAQQTAKCGECNLTHCLRGKHCLAFGRLCYKCRNYNHFARCCKTGYRSVPFYHDSQYE